MRRGLILHPRMEAGNASSDRPLEEVCLLAYLRFQVGYSDMPDWVWPTLKDALTQNAVADEDVEKILTCEVKKRKGADLPDNPGGAS